MTRPPRAAEFLVTLFLPGGSIRESVLGDLHEMYLERVSDPRMGVKRARRWYWIQSVRLSLSYGAMRLFRTPMRSFATPPPPASTAAPAWNSGMKGEVVADVVRQLRFSLRSLFRSPGFAVPALAILAIGMTAATAIFTVVDSVVFRPLDFPESDRLVIVCEDRLGATEYCIASPGNTEDLRSGATTLVELGIARGWAFHLTDSHGTEGVRGGLASAGFLRALSVQPAVGRIFTDDEHGPDDDKVVLLSHSFWTSRYQADPAVVGAQVVVDGETHLVVGVLPAGFDLPFDLGGIKLWKPPHFSLRDPDVRRWRGFRSVGRLAEGSSIAAASAELTGIYSGLGERYQEVDDEWRLRVQPLLQEVVGNARPVLMAFLGAAALLLLIVCANVANLLLARGLGRRQEFAVRAALGAGRGRLVREILAESLVLSGMAAVLALALSHGATRLLLALAPPGIPRLDEVVVDGRVLMFTVLLAAGATVLFASLPALRVTAWNLGPSLKGGRSGDSVRSARLQSALVVTELALSVVLLSSAALLTRSFMEYLEWEPGFDRDALLAVSAIGDPGTYKTRAEFMALFQRAEELVAAVPGVTSVATASAGPLFGGGDGTTPFVSAGADRTGTLPSASYFDIGPGYFETLGLPLMRGREFTEADRPGVALVAVVNEALARRAWPNGTAVGEVIDLPELELALEVIGVVADVQPLEPGEVPLPEVYFANRQLGRLATWFLIRTSGEPGALTRAVTEAMLLADPDLSLGTPRTLSSQADRELVRPRFQAIILLTFALAALILSAVGVYAVVSYSAARRTRETGIRVAMGARASDVVKQMVRTHLTVVVVGISVGLAGAFPAGRLLQGLIPGVSPTDFLSLAAGSGVLLLAAALAILLPARRATRVDPLGALRAD